MDSIKQNHIKAPEWGHVYGRYYLLWTQRRAATLMADESISQWLCPWRTARQRGVVLMLNSLSPPAGISHRSLSLFHKKAAIIKGWAVEGKMSENFQVLSDIEDERQVRRSHNPPAPLLKRHDTLENCDWLWCCNSWGDSHQHGTKKKNVTQFSLRPHKVTWWLCYLVVDAGICENIRHWLLYLSLPLSDTKRPQHSCYNRN